MVNLIAPLVVFAGYVAFGISGFGSAIIVVPILAQFLPLKFVAPLMVLLDLSAILMVWANVCLRALAGLPYAWQPGPTSLSHRIVDIRENSSIVL